jgi:hypothetical protein
MTRTHDSPPGRAKGVPQEENGASFAAHRRHSAR